MNIKILQWLLKNRDALLQVVAIAKTYDKSAGYIAQWEVVDKIARIVLPILQAEASAPKLLDYDFAEWDSEADVAFAAGAEVSALGVDWQLIVDVVIPILISILQAIANNRE